MIDEDVSLFWTTLVGIACFCFICFAASTEWLFKAYALWILINIYKNTKK